MRELRNDLEASQTTQDSREPLLAEGLSSTHEAPSPEQLIAWQADGFQLLADLSAKLISSDLSLHSFTETFQRIADHLDCDVFTNFEVYENRLVLIESSGLPESLRLSLKTINFGEQLCGFCAEQNRVIYVSADELETHPHGTNLWEMGIRSFVVAPIKSDGRLQGTLGFGSSRRHSFSPTEVDFVRNVSSMIAAFKARYESEVKLRQAKSHQEITLGTVKNVIFESDPEGLRFSFISGAYEDLLGFSYEEWTSPGFWQSRVHEDDLAAAVAYCQANTKLLRDHRFEYRMINKDGDVVWIEDFVQVIAENGQPVALQGSLMDISERKRLEFELQQSQKMQAIGRLAGGIAHDFNNVLTVISTYAELMLGRLNEHDAHHGPVKAIREASERAAALTSQLLVFSRKSTSESKVLNLNEIVRGSEKLLNRVIGEDILLETRLSDDIANIRSDRSQIEQVILNLAINARDSMPDGGRVVLATNHVEITSDTSDSERLLPGKYVELIVADTGCGMDEETLEKCFEPFFSTKPIGMGTGLGLSVTYGVVKDAGGSIKADSTVGAGTKFTILIPASENSDVVPTPQPKHMEIPKDTGRVLLVEDEASVRKVARMTLEMCGYEVIEAQSGQHALEVVDGAEVGEINMLVTDLIMPGMNGLALAERLKQQFDDLKVLFISGYGEDELSFRNSHGKDVSLLTKPFTAKGLMEAAQNVMRG